MLKCLNERVRDLHPQTPQGRRLTVVPIRGPSQATPAYELLTHENLQKVRVTEVSSEGSVPVLNVVNELDVSVFLLDGQELAGLKQNRILNTDVLVPARSEVKIPVSCVEQGRWHGNVAQFDVGKTASRRMRAGKAERVRASLVSDRGHDADQGAVWQEVAATLNRSGVASPTGALAEAYQQREKDLEQFRREVTLPAETVGAAVFRREEFLGLDLFDRQSTLEYFWKSLADSYAVELLDQSPETPAQDVSRLESVVQVLLSDVSSGKWEAFATPGEGRDWRLEHDRYSASALVWDDQSVIHLQVFPRARETGASDWRPRIRRPYPPR